MGGHLNDGRAWTLDSVFAFRKGGERLVKTTGEGGRRNGVFHDEAARPTASHYSRLPRTEHFASFQSGSGIAARCASAIRPETYFLYATRAKKSRTAAVITLTTCLRQPQSRAVGEMGASMMKGLGRPLPILPVGKMG